MAEPEGSSTVLKRTLIEISSSSSAYSEEDNALESESDSESQSYDTSSESKSEDSVEEITYSTSWYLFLILFPS